jgi:hypothetical protein
MNRKMLLFTAMLFLMLTLRYAFGQDDLGRIGWEPENVYEPADTVLAVMMFAPIVGLIIGVIRVWNRESMRPVLQPLRLR